MELLLDGSNILWRAHWVSKNMMKGESKEFGEVHLFLNMVKSYMKMHPKSQVWVAWDKKLDRDIKNPRYGDCEAYKTGRTSDSVYDNCEKLIEALEAVGVHNFYPSHLEADDCIAWLTKQLSPCTIFSADNDLAQLINERVCVYNVNKKKLITTDNFEDVFGVPLDVFTVHKAISGDKSDNIEGIPGYGFKRSLTLARKYQAGDVSDEHKSKIDDNLKLMDLVNNHYMDDLELKRYNEQFTKAKSRGRNDTDFDKFNNLLLEMNLEKQIDKLPEWKSLTKESDLFSALKTLNVVNTA